MAGHGNRADELELEEISEYALPEHGAAPKRFKTINNFFKYLTEIPAAILVAVEVCVLLAGVISRYVFDAPLTWTDELASILFLWLAMLGAVIALQRGEHMRLTTFVNKLPLKWRNPVESFASMISAVFIFLLIHPAFEFAHEQWEITTPALALRDSYRASAILVGLTLMFLLSVLRAFEKSTVKQAVISFAAVAVFGAALWLATPSLMEMGNLNMLVYFVLVIAICVASGVPIGFSFGISTVAYLTLTASETPLGIVISRMDEGMSTLILLSVPLFVFLGLLLEMTGLATVLVNFLGSLLGHVRGGLNYVLIGAMYLVSGISGAKAADMAAIAPVLFPEMKRRGAKPGELVALLSATGAQTETIPPSLVLITIGSVCGVSIAALFTGGLLPALICGIGLAGVAFFRSRHDNLEGVVKASWKTIGKTFIIALPAVSLPFFIRAAVVEGIATATEVSTLGIAYTFVLGLLVYRQFDWKKLYPMMVDTAALSGAILSIIGLATAMGWALAQSGFSQSLAEAMSLVPGGQFGFLVVSILAFCILGSVLEGIPAIVLFGPLLFPIARAAGVHEVHYAMVVVIAMGVGLFAPPLGVGYYAACAIGKADPNEAMQAIWPYLAVLVICLFLLAAFPWLSIGFLPAAV